MILIITFLISQHDIDIKMANMVMKQRERGEGDRKMYHYFHYYSVLFIGIIPNIKLFRAYTS